MRLRAIRYSSDSFRMFEVENTGDLKINPSPDSVLWLQVFGIGDSESLTELGRHLGIHKLTLEDIQNTDRRFSMERYPDYTFQTIKRISAVSDAGIPEVETLSLLQMKETVISFHETEAVSWDRFVGRIESGTGRIRRSDAGYLLYAINDEALDTWMVHLESVEDRLLELEDQVLMRFDETLIETIHSWKKHIAWMRWMFRPYRDLLSHLNSPDFPWFQSRESPYLKDLTDHAVRIIDVVELYRDMVDDLLMVHMTVLSNRMNRIMKVLTIISTIFIPITFIAGIYGMNFIDMPELSWRWGYPVILAVMFVLVTGMLIVFRRKRWI